MKNTFVVLSICSLFLLGLIFHYARTNDYLRKEIEQLKTENATLREELNTDIVLEMDTISVYLPEDLKPTRYILKRDTTKRVPVTIYFGGAE